MSNLLPDIVTVVMSRTPPSTSTRRTKEAADPERDVPRARRHPSQNGPPPRSRSMTASRTAGFPSTPRPSPIAPLYSAEATPACVS